jgi:probable rRNA maturation factor
MTTIVNNTDQKLPFKKTAIKNWIEHCVSSYGYKSGTLSFLLENDEEVLRVNQQYLQHDFYTDIITFDNTVGKELSADILISMDRVKDNALLHKVDFSNEFLRVLAHGILHCIGYTDKSDSESEIMRKEEDHCIEMFHVKQF